MAIVKAEYYRRGSYIGAWTRFKNLLQIKPVSNVFYFFEATFYYFHYGMAFKHQKFFLFSANI